MNNGSNRIFDEIAKMLTDAGGAAQSFRKEVENVFRTQAEKAIHKLDLVKREDYEILKEMLIKESQEREALSVRVQALEEKNQKA